MESPARDPKKIGPGYWDRIHSTALSADEYTKQMGFVQWMKNMCEDFPCRKCSKHCKEYLHKNPPKDSVGKGAMAMFIWAWKFHNAVNQRLGKPEMSYETALGIYTTTH